MVIFSKRLVVRVDEERRRPEMTAEAFDGPDDATGLEVDGCPDSFVFDGGATDDDNRANGSVRLFLIEGGAKTVCAGFAVEV